MSIKCSLLGHDFGETTVEREREEEGTEVVITITEMETCTRCGESRVVSENKEVTTLETPDEGGEAGGGSSSVGGPADETPSSSEATDEFATTAGEGDDPAEQNDAVILDDESDVESTAQAEARGGEPTIPDAESEDAVDPDTDEDDAVIIGDAESGDESETEDGRDDAPEAHDTGADVSGTAGESGQADADDAADTTGEDDRAPGEWPDDDTDPAERAGESDEVEILDDGPASSDGDATESGESVDAEAESVGNAFNDPASAVEADEGSEMATEQSNSTDDPSEGADDRNVGAWPDEEGSASGTDAMGEWPEETLRDDPAGEAGSEPTLERVEGHSITVPEGKFKCSECGFTTDVESSSLRAGDFCPECHRGTLLQHEGQPSDES